jgi:mRNA interferase MazF
MDIEKDFDRWNTGKKEIERNRPMADCHEREIWWCVIGVNVGSEQHSQTSDFSRPVVVIRRFTRDLFWAIPLTTKLKDVAFRKRLVVGEIENDALILQMRCYDRKRLIRKIGVVPQKAFKGLQRAIVTAVLNTTDPAFAGSSEAEANV